MKKRALTYADDGRIRALLDRYACPTSFHVVRTRFLGDIVTPTLGVAPFRTIEGLWGGNLPEFDDASAADELFEALMSLWNELVKHQSETKPFRLTRVAVKAKPDDPVACAAPAQKNWKVSSRVCSAPRRLSILPSGPTKP